MPLSDAVRAMLAARTGQPAPADAPPSPPTVEKPPATEDQQGFRDRARREEERFTLATDSEYWLAFCFRTPGHRHRFAAALGFTTTAYIAGPALEQATAHKPKANPLDRAKRMLAARSTRDHDLTGQLATSTVPDPFASLPKLADLVADTADEVAALFDLLTAPPDPAPANVLDSQHWLVAYWPARGPKEEWLAATGVDVLGDKYLDGHRAATILGLTI